MDDRELTELFYDVARIGHQREMRGGRQSSGGGQTRCLLTLSGLGPVSQRRLAAILGIRSASLSELLAKMETRGWVARTPHPRDGRTYLVALTTSGEAEALRRRSAATGASIELLEALDAEQRGQFAAILTIIREHYRQLEDNEGKNEGTGGEGRRE